MGTGLNQHQSDSICMTQIAEMGFPQAIRQFDIGHQKSPRDMLPIMLPYIVARSGSGYRATRGGYIIHMVLYYTCI